MVTIFRERMTRSLPLWGGGLGGAVTALGFLILPGDMLEGLVSASGIAAIVPAAEPPLGITARALLALGLGSVVFAVLWSALYLLFGPGGLFAAAPLGEDGAPVVRRADSHPDAPPRKPLNAAELGAPMMPPRVRALPADLDQPLAAFDPQAVPDAPLAPVQAVVPLARPERMATFALPPTRSVETPAPMAQPSAPTIEALLRRLEESTRQRSRMSPQ